jgi:hypothetical protein
LVGSKVSAHRVFRNRVMRYGFEVAKIGAPDGLHPFA